jgi:hypothetical protein
MFYYIIFSLVYMGWPAICYCAEGHIENIHAIIGCMDDKVLAPKCMDNSPSAAFNDKIYCSPGSNTCDTCIDTVISIHFFWNQPISIRNIVQTGKANHAVFYPLILMISGTDTGRYSPTISDRFDRLNSTLQSVHLLI